jgi:hypothetical protein
MRNTKLTRQPSSIWRGNKSARQPHGSVLAEQDVSATENVTGCTRKKLSRLLRNSMRPRYNGPISLRPFYSSLLWV